MARWRVASRLDGLHVSGLANARAHLADGPVVFASTHTSWWDPVVAMVLAEALGGEHAFLMDAQNLARVRWFAALGALPLDRSSPAAARAGLRLGERSLSGPGRALWVFPQGRQRPTWLRPLGVTRGAAWLAERTSADLVPVALAYGFREAPVPAAVVRFGEPCAAESLEVDLIDGLTAIDRFLDDATTPGFEALVPSRQTREDDGLPSRALSLLVGR